MFGIEHNFTVESVVSLYAGWLKEGRLQVDPERNGDIVVSLHDPCNVVRKAEMAGFPSIADDARYVLHRVVKNFVELDPNRENNYCCSGGGGALISGYARARTYFGKVKIDQIKRSGAEKVCTPCVNCFDGLNNLAKAYKDDWKFESVHLWTLLANAIVLDNDGSSEQGRAD